MSCLDFNFSKNRKKNKGQAMLNSVDLNFEIVSVLI